MEGCLMAERLIGHLKTTYKRGWLEVGYGKEGGYEWRKVISGEVMVSLGKRGWGYRQGGHSERESRWTTTYE